MKIIEWFTEICNRSMEISYVILTIFILRFIFGKIKLPKKYSYYLWAIPMIRLVCPISFSSVFSLFNAVRHMPKISVQQGNGYVPFQMQEPVSAAGTGNTVSVMHMLSEAPDHSRSLLILWIACVWIAGIAVFGIYSIFSFIRTKKMVSTAVRRESNVYECDRIRSPFVLGIIFPQIYIPFRMNDSELDYILRHERYHIKRKDHIIKLVFFMVTAVYWFHPLVWAAFFCMTRDMEMSCDEQILMEMGGGIKQQYSMSLLSFASNRRMNLAGPLAFGETDTKKRVRNILNFQRPKTWLAVTGVLLVAAAAVVCLTNQKEDKLQSEMQETVKNLSGGFEKENDISEGIRLEKTVVETVSSKNGENIQMFLRKWVGAFCGRDGETIAALTTDAAQASLEDSELLFKYQDGYTFGYSSPWPLEDGGYRILESDETSAEILYYAWTSDPHLTVWRESLALQKSEDGYKVADHTIKNFDEITSLDEFLLAYPGGVISNTMMDYEANGLGEVLNQHAKEQKTSGYYGGFFHPEWAARCLLNLSQDENLVSVEFTEETKSVIIKFARENAVTGISMIQPYGEDGIWIPGSYSDASNLLAEDQEEGIAIYGLVSNEGKDQVKIVADGAETALDCNWDYVGHFNKIKVFERTKDGRPKTFAFTMLYENTSTSEIWRLFVINRDETGHLEMHEFLPEDYMTQARKMMDLKIDDGRVLRIWGNGKALAKESVPENVHDNAEPVILENLAFMDADDSGLMVNLAVGYQEEGRIVATAKSPIVFRVGYSGLEDNKFILEDVGIDMDHEINPWLSIKN